MNGYTWAAPVAEAKVSGQAALGAGDLREYRIDDLVVVAQEHHGRLPCRGVLRRDFGERRDDDR